MRTVADILADSTEHTAALSKPGDARSGWGPGQLLPERRGPRTSKPEHEPRSLPPMQPERITILAVDDDADDAEILRRNLELAEHFAFDFIHVTSAEAACAALADVKPDVVFLDYLLGGAIGLDVLKQMRGSGFRGPVIMVTGQSDKYVVADLIRAGADDYVGKADLCPVVLERAINNAMRSHWRRALEARNRELVEELQAARDALEQKNRRLAELYELAHRFVADVSHDFRTPLTVIKEFAEILLDGLAGNLTDEQREYIGYITERTDDLSAMVTDLLDLSHNDAGLLRVVRAERTPREIVERALRALQRKAASAQVRLELDVPDDLPRVYCDFERIGRVLINLTVNAMKFSPKGGAVRVWARPDEDPSVVRMGVTDQGPGIAPEDQATLFERFRQVQRDGRTTRQGFGLGLSIARELVQLNLGEIGVDSRLEQGSTFWFTVPIASPDAVARQYLWYLERAHPGRAVAVLLHVRTEAEADRRAVDELDNFLQNTLRCRDVPMRIAPSQWFILAGIERADVSGLTGRIESAWREANRNRPASPLPELHFTTLDAWRHGEAFEPFVGRIVQTVTAAAPA